MLLFVIVGRFWLIVVCCLLFGVDCRCVMFGVAGCRVLTAVCRTCLSFVIARGRLSPV